MTIPTLETAGPRGTSRKNANVTPEFVELRREIADRRDRLVRRLRAHRSWLAVRVESELRSAVGELNALVAQHNLKVPFGLQIPLLTLELLCERAQAREREL